MQDKFHNLKLDDIYNRIGDKVKARRNKKGMYLKVDIATALEVNPQDISNWAFRGRFPWPELFIFSQKHNIPFDLLLTGKEQQDNFMRGWPEDAVEYCQKLKSVLENSEEKEITTIKEMIDIYINKCKSKKRVVKKGTG